MCVILCAMLTGVFLCFQAIDLVNYKTYIFDYVESRMSFIAPNLSVILGATSAAKIMGEYVFCINIINYLQFL